MATPAAVFFVILFSSLILWLDRRSGPCPCPECAELRARGGKGVES